ncbi:MAG: hypothetical protein OEV48_07205 [Acidobacteriota bacterium]|jgi:hypothetical protein|nr:hypothetical protein [Acidobacteriota bacterium]
MNRQLKAEVTSFLTMALVIVVPAFAQIPEGVSPGAVDRTAEIEGRCPTFIWNSVPGAAFHELIGYRLSEFSDLTYPSEIDLSNADQILYAKVAGSAPAWEPELAECLTPGSSYVWFVRAVYLEENGEVAEASEWSNGRYFSISSVPSALEVEEALRVLRRHSEHHVESEEFSAERAETMPAAPSRQVEVPQQVPKSVTSAKTAIKGTVSDATGETYGVVGTSNSPDGAGVAAANTNGGPDLVLDGSEDYLPDAEFSQSGINLPWGSPQTFNIHNSTGLGMTLQVDGVDVVTTQSDLDSLGALSCGSGQIAKWTGSEWECLADEDHLSALGCAEGEIAKLIGSTWVCAADNDTLYTPGVGSIASAEVLDDSLTAADLDANSVGISELETTAIFEPVQNVQTSASFQIIETIYTTGETLTSKTLSAPTSGTALATASCSYFCSSCSESNPVAGAYTTIMTTDTGSTRTGDENYARLLYNPSGNEFHSMALADVFVVSQGDTTFYLRSGAQDEGDSISMGLCSLSVVFIPD